MNLTAPRQIVASLFTGDFVDLADGDTQVFSAEAMVPASLCRFRESAFRALIQDFPPLKDGLLNRTWHEACHA